MKKVTKPFAILCLLTLLSCLSLSACQKKESYADDIPCSELMDAVEDQLPVNFGYETFGGDHLRYYFEDTKLPDDACLRYSVLSEDINEIGIFHTTNAESGEEVKDLAEDYLEELLEDQRAFIASYAPEELPKLERAEIRTFGNYTVYAILDDEDRALAFETIEKKLTKK